MNSLKIVQYSSLSSKVFSLGCGSFGEVQTVTLRDEVNQPTTQLAVKKVHFKYTKAVQKIHRQKSFVSDSNLLKNVREINQLSDLQTFRSLFLVHTPLPSQIIEMVLDYYLILCPETKPLYYHVLMHYCHFNHPNLLHLQGVAVHRCYLYFLMERFTINLHTLATEELPPRDWKFWWNTLRQILLGLRELHTRNVVHQRLHTQNVLFRANGNVILSDFGEFVEEKDSDDEAVKEPNHGPLRFLAPEVLQTCDLHSKAADVFSFGMIVYVVSTGRIPFGGLSSSQVSLQIYNEKRPLIPPAVAVPSYFIQLMERCWAQTPSKRPRVDELVKEFGSECPF